jgi:hypothetical protein
LNAFSFDLSSELNTIPTKRCEIKLEQFANVRQ